MWPSDIGLQFEEVLFKGEQGDLYGWWLPAQNKANADKPELAVSSKGTIVFAHGNAGNVSSHLGFIYWLPTQGYDVFMFDYRGYGRSQGKPSAQGIVDDTHSAIAYVRQRMGDVPLVIYGHSLGGATSISALATLDNKQNIKGLIVDSAFSNYRSIAKEKAKTHWLTSVLSPFVPMLVTGSPKPNELVQYIAPIPTYFAHGPNDEVIPLSESQVLFDQANNPKHWYTLKAQQHNHGWQQADDRRWLLIVLSQLFSSQ